MVVGNLIFILNLLVVTKKSITNSSKNLVFQVNVFVSFILQSCFKYMIMTTIKKKKSLRSWLQSFFTRWKYGNYKH